MYWELIYFFFSSFRDTLFLYCDRKPCTYDVIYMMRLLLQFFHLSLHVLFLFSFYAHDSYMLYAIFYFYFTLRCHDEFCLKCFRNTGYQSLLVINSFLAKFFKSLCQNRFYCIQKVSMSWMIYDFPHMFICCCDFVTDCQRGRLLGHMWIIVRNICKYRIG